MGCHHLLTNNHPWYKLQSQVHASLNATLITTLIVHKYHNRCKVIQLWFILSNKDTNKGSSTQLSIQVSREGTSIDKQSLTKEYTRAIVGIQILL